MIDIGGSGAFKDCYFLNEKIFVVNYKGLLVLSTTGPSCLACVVGVERGRGLVGREKGRGIGNSR